jgi:hypothetical protein
MPGDGDIVGRLSALRSLIKVLYTLSTVLLR